MRRGVLAAAAGARRRRYSGCAAQVAGDTQARRLLIEDATSLAARAARRRQRARELLTLAGIAIAAADETKHFKLIGTTGTGKSTAIRELLGAALARGDRAVIADPDGGYCARFYRSLSRRHRPQSLRSGVGPMGSVRRNPEQLRCRTAGQRPDSLQRDASASEWRGYARTFLTAVLRRCQLAAGATVAELWRLLAVRPREELRPLSPARRRSRFSIPRTPGCSARYDRWRCRRSRRSSTSRRSGQRRSRCASG